jgi:hypothetical protein
MKQKIVLLALCLSMSAQAACFSEGVRVGTIQKFSQKGVVKKSWEGELVMEGTKFSAGSGGNIWKFSVQEQAVATSIDNATMSGKPVALRYCQVYMKLGQTDTDYIVTQAVERK